MPEQSLLDAQRFFAPEVIQTSAMDCGPAALKCLLEGFGIPVSYGRLREACQTDVDGTSIDTLEDIAQQLGLVAEQMIAPVDHLLLADAHLLPALVVVRLPDGLPHFVIAWRVLGPYVQIMDPATGRRWVHRERFLRELYRHAMPFPADAWRAWAGEAGFSEPLRQRLEALQLSPRQVEERLATALADPHWYLLATLDAATRFVSTLVAANGVEAGPEAAQLLDSLWQQIQQGEQATTAIIPGAFWFVQPLLAARTQEAEAEQLLLRGAVLIRVQGRRSPIQATATSASPIAEAMASQAEPNPTTYPTPLSPALRLALTEAPSRPEWEVWRVLQRDGWLTPTVVFLATLLAAASVTLEALLLRGVVNLPLPLAVAGQPLVLIGVCVFIFLLLCLELPLTHTLLRMGRRLETRLRIALLQKLPRLGDQYFRSRLVSDMASRAHGLHHLHALPELALRTLRLSMQLLLTAAALIWLYPTSAIPALLATFFALGAALLTQPILAERDMRVRTHAGALSRFYLDALLGLTPIRSHSAARMVRREQEMRLTAWAKAHLAFYELQQILQAAVAVMSALFAIMIVLTYLTAGGEASGVLLLLYWALALPALGQALVTNMQQYPIQRNQLLRLLEPLGAPDEESPPNAATAIVTTTATAHRQQNRSKKRTKKQAGNATPQGTTLALKGVSVSAGGHAILTKIDLTIRAGEHVAIVGASGAGKSSLVGLFLGWHRPATGELLVDGQTLTGDHLLALRRVTAWVDPAVQLWNRTLLENLAYGLLPPVAPLASPSTAAPMPNHDPRWTTMWAAADLYPLLERLPGGLQARLGESGGLVSGGEGQRVRLGRALLRPGVRLVILDEPFRGLDRQTRRQLLTSARQQWQTATLLCVTHDIHATQDFTRVLVLEQGQIVEDGPPALLAAQPQSRYRALLVAEETVQRTLWEGAAWRHLWLADGAMAERARKDHL
ncbi:MAG: ATP-binding cassette domain-containing protein [Caldilineaceae bacterium]|nr:ATP-binding cassette domain-containing protein [Caldilineaceae bacterium]